MYKCTTCNITRAEPIRWREPHGETLSGCPKCHGGMEQSDTSIDELETIREQMNDVADILLTYAEYNQDAGYYEAAEKMNKLAREALYIRKSVEIEIRDLEVWG